MKKLLTLSMAAMMAWSVSAQSLLPLPFHDDFDHHDNFSMIDSNNDYLGWGLLFQPSTNSFGSIRYDDREAHKSADDWVVFPYFKYEKGLRYKVTLSARMSGPGTADFECFLGKGNDDMDDSEVSKWTKVTDVWQIKNDDINVYHDHSIEFTAPESGEYRFALHFVSPINNQLYELDWITLGEGLEDSSPLQSVCSAPKYTGVDGKLKVTFHITPDAKDVSGANVANTLTAKVVRIADGKAEKTFDCEGLAPGVEYEFSDPDAYGIPAEYDVFVYNGGARGMKRIVLSTPTISKPEKPTNVVIAHLPDGSFTATWEPVTKGTSSFYPFMPASVTYTATDHAGNPIELTMTAPCAAKFTYPEVTEGQIGAYINLYANNEAGAGAAGKSNAIVIGVPLKGEFNENFTGKAFTQNVWGVEPATGAWSVSSTAIKGTDGQPGILAYGQAAEKNGELISPILDLSAMERPFVSMYVYIKPASAYNNKITPVIRGYEGDTDYPLCEAFTDHTLVDGSALPEADGWHKYTWQVKGVPADKLAKCNLVLKGEGGSSWNYIYMDEICIKDYPVDTDAALTEIVTPKKSATVGKDAPVLVTVKNQGFNTFSNYEVVISNEDGKVLASAGGENLLPESAQTIEVNMPVLPEYAGKDVAFTATLVAEGDERNGNDLMEGSLTVAKNLLPTVRNLTLTEGDDQDILSWDAPEAGESGMQEFTEDFSEWEPCVIPTGTFNGWTFVDVDGNTSWGVEEGDPFTGQKSAVKIYSKFGVENSAAMLVPRVKDDASGLIYGVADKWIILPEIVEKNIVSFQRMAYQCYGKSSAVKLEYCYSTTDTKPESFSYFIDEETIDTKAAAEWATKEFEVPAGAKYFAIHVKDCQAKYIAFDNFSYVSAVGAPVLQSYNVYYNGDKVQTCAADANEYTHQHNASSAEKAASVVVRSYYVSSVYDQGESGAGEIVSNAQSGVGSIDATKAGFKVIGTSVVASAETTVTDLQGRTIARLAEGQSVELSRGIYIVVSGNCIAKVMVK